MIVTWYTPEEKLPEADRLCVLSVLGRVCNVGFDHTFEIGAYCPGEGWYLASIDTEDEMDMLTVHAWCDLEPYRGG